MFLTAVLKSEVLETVYFWRGFGNFEAWDIHE